ncbi:MAG: phosphatase PAP2 family protein [Thermoplasmata archaeon]|nr:phosphatase PAP2 family protein [Thermoplasmata archaeon]
MRANGYFGPMRANPRFPRHLDRVLVISLLVFLTVVIVVDGRISQACDEMIVREVSERRHPYMTTAMVAVTHLGSFHVLWAMAIPVAGLFIWLRRFDFAIVHLSLLAGAGLIADAIKVMTQRARPLGAPEWSTYSFPSGHTMAAMSFYFGLFFLISLLHDDRLMRRRLRAIGLAFAGLVGFSRVYLAAHYPTDVIAAVALSFVWMSAVGLIYLKGVPACRADELETSLRGKLRPRSCARAR